MIITCLTKIYKVVTHFNDDAYNVRKDNPDMVGEEYTGADKTLTFNIQRRSTAMTMRSYFWFFF